MYDIICVTNRKLCQENFFIRLEKIAQSDLKCIILREKDLSADNYRRLAEEAIEICHKYNKPCILHSYPEIAIELGADGVHLTMDMFRNLTKKEIFTGVSCHSVDEAKEAETLGADYIIAGHIFQTDCKKNLTPRGLDFLHEVCDTVKIPVYAIGGINKNNIESVIRVGASGGCMMSELMRGNISGY